MKEELRRNAPGATPVKRRAGSQASQQAVGDLSALPGKSPFRRQLQLLKTWLIYQDASYTHFLSFRNDLLLPGVCGQRADAEHFHHHPEDPEKGDWDQECNSDLRDVSCPARLTPAAQQSGAGVRQIRLSGGLSTTMSAVQTFLWKLLSRDSQDFKSDTWMGFFFSHFIFHGLRHKNSALLKNEKICTCYFI